MRNRFDMKVKSTARIFTELVRPHSPRKSFARRRHHQSRVLHCYPRRGAHGCREELIRTRGLADHNALPGKALCLTIVLVRHGPSQHAMEECDGSSSSAATFLTSISVRNQAKCVACKSTLIPTRIGLRQRIPAW